MRNSDVSSREEKEARETILQNASLKPLRYYHADEEKANTTTIKRVEVVLFRRRRKRGRVGVVTADIASGVRGRQRSAI